MYRNIVIEPLGTLVNYDWREYLMHRFLSAKMEERVYALTAGSEEWRAVDLGNMSRRMAEITMMKRAKAEGLAFEVQAVLDDWPSILNDHEHMVHLLSRYKNQGVHFYYLSGMAQDTRELLKEHPFWRLFEGGVASCDTHSPMPDEAVFHALLRSNALLEKETLYIDTNAANVQVARELGMAALQYRGAGRLARSLETETH